MPDIDAKKIEELLPCPFCGGAAQAEHFESKLGRWRWSIGCNDHTSKADDGGEPAAECYGFQSMTSFATKAEAIAAWNRRASHSLASASGGEDSPAGILDVQRMLTIHQPKGGDANANGSRDASKPIPATSPGVTAGASAGWQSIETAPRDGTRFLTWDSYYGVRMGRAFMRADHDDWLSYVDSNGSSHKGGIRASHWMPLPAVPVDGGEDA